MQAMQIIRTTAQEWGVFVQMREVLCKVSAFSEAGQSSSCGNARGNSKISGESWAGQNLGVRQPDDDETPLSQSEVRFANIKRLL